MYIVIDVVFVLFVALMFFFGFRKGFMTKAWWLVDLALIVVLGILVAPTVLAGMQGTALYASVLNKFTAWQTSGTLTISNPETITNVIFSIAIWILLALAVVIVMAILKAVFRGLYKYRAFRFIDKLFGGIYSAAFTVALLFAIGAVVGTFVDFQPIAKAADYCSHTYVFKYIFGENPLRGRMEESFNIGGWIYNALYGAQQTVPEVPETEETAESLFRLFRNAI